jgi:acetyl esterase/lipase
MKAVPPYLKHTDTYKTHDNTPIKLDIYRPLVTLNTGEENENPKPKPILVYFHGGYLVCLPLPLTLHSFN